MPNGTRQECQEWLKETIKQVDTGLTYDVAQIKLSEFLENWLVSIQTSIRATTFYNYSLYEYKHILPLIGKYYMRDLRPDLIQSFYNQKIKNGSSGSTAQYMHRVLHKALSQAVIAGIITRNPTEGALISKPKHKEMKFYDEIQSSQLLLAVKGTRNEALYQLELSTGMRQSELLALKWSDLDWTNQTITIQRQLVRNSKSKEEYFSDLKTDAANRTISLGDYTIQKLREHMEYQTTERMDPSREMWIENDMIFPSIVGTPMNQSNLYKSFKNTIREAGLPEIRFHDLRHTAASLMLNHGVPAIIVSNRLGHSKVSITLDIYGHLIQQMQDGPAEMIDQLITPIAMDDMAFDISCTQDHQINTQVEPVAPK